MLGTTVPQPSRAPDATATLIHAEQVEAALAPREWTVGPGDVQVFLVGSRRAALVGAGGRIELSGPALAWMAGGEAHTLRLEAGGRGHRLTVAADVLAGAVSGVPGAARLRRFLGRSAAITGPRLSPFLREVTQSFEVLSRETKEPGEATPGIVAAHLALLYLHVSRLAAAEQGAGGAAPEGAGSIAQRFLNLVELHLRDGWTVKRYADALCVTEDRLHAVALRSHGKPPGLLVRERLLAEACSQLQATEAPVEQIAFALGFRDPAYFSRFCRRHLGSPPGRYRREWRAQRSRPTANSFAAWP